MTIEEARTKECRQIPAFMQSTSDSNLIDSGSVQFIPSKCSANECMHWRWHEEFITDHQCETFLNEDGRLEYKPRPMLSKTSGYCGLSGKKGSE